MPYNALSSNCQLNHRSRKRTFGRVKSKPDLLLVNRVDSWNPAPGARPGVVFEDLCAGPQYRRHSSSRSRSRTPPRFTGSRSPSPEVEGCVLVSRHLSVLEGPLRQQS
ncbi:hypothetical protein BDZ89DRAFT_1067344 [Hymenopellis radicata]|nr:hypothetical protein BDZ89DRAFT_1067344 [Hymenopellis radicata]